jgi:uncharacterized integral membrane protein
VISAIPSPITHAATVSTIGAIQLLLPPLLRVVQALWALGVAGAGYLLLAHPEQPLPLLVAQQPWSVWLVGPAAAAVTGAHGCESVSQQYQSAVVKL